MLVEGRQPAAAQQPATAATPGVGASASQWPQGSQAPVQQAHRLKLPFEAPPSVPDATPLDLGRMGSPRPESEPGARPLVDEKMGWQTGQSPLYIPPDGSATRVPDVDIRVVTRRGWILFVILMLAGLGTGMLIALQSS